MSSHQTVVVLDYGSQYTRLITRRIRELGIYSIILDARAAESDVEKIFQHNPKAIILSGGPSSVYETNAPKLSPDFLSRQSKANIPVLGICYGLQLLAQTLGGEVRASEKREYGRVSIDVADNSSVFPMAITKSLNVWMSHGDSISKLPEGFRVIAKSFMGAIAAVEDSSRNLYGLQFHPEVSHTEFGTDLLKHFFTEVAHIKPDWNMKSVVEEQIEKIKSLVGPDQHVLCGLSGGVDSTVAAVLVHRAIGDRLHCVFVDHGLLRFEERERVMKMFKDDLQLPVNCVEDEKKFLSKLKGVVDPEEKRRIIGTEFIESFESFAQGLKSKIGQLPNYLVQGTLYPDVIESSVGHATATTIKTHHNVGGLPKNLRFQLIEPLRDLFKDEVRELGRTLKIPENFLMRHPFPGPGLAVRIIGEITPERLDMLRKADEIYISSIRESDLYSKIWQAFAVFLPIKSVGVQGDGRTHDHVIALRAVTSTDGMTADWYPFEAQFLAKVSNRICNEVKGVNRVVYDISSKPPATIEWE
jgi:GMP synthase (glutamine-hydrolysing)